MSRAPTPKPLAAAPAGPEGRDDLTSEAKGLLATSSVHAKQRDGKQEPPQAAHDLQIVRDQREPGQGQGQQLKQKLAGAGAEAPAGRPATRLRVIGAGFGRTGTLSLKTALNMLGYKTHHMIEVLYDQPRQPHLWLRAAVDRDAGRPIDWDVIFGPGGYDAAVDWPAVTFWKELIEAYPDVKVILTVRDFDRWYDSAAATIYRISESTAPLVRPPVWLVARLPRWLLPLVGSAQQAMAHALIWRGTFQGRFKDREFARQVYESHVAEVRRVVPPSRLLEFSPRDGWAPLCAFLGVTPPEGEPFPHVNDTADFQTRSTTWRSALLRERAVAAGVAAGVVGAAAVGVGAAVRAVANRRG